jgi:hypothetical protein
LYGNQKFVNYRTSLIEEVSQEDDESFRASSLKKMKGFSEPLAGSYNLKSNINIQQVASTTMPTKFN